MKKCLNCGCDNDDKANFCLSCGTKLENLLSNESLDFNPNNESTPQQSIDYQNEQQTFNNQPNTYQGQNYQVQPQKNATIAVILDIIGGLIFYFLSGIGQLYLGLYKRGIVLCVMGVIVTIINVIIISNFDDIGGYLITLILGIALVVYSAYDAYKCTNAINAGQPVPLLFGAMDIE
ncbi:MAG: zinc ribbon domain-containing protein [Methanosphaera stadtmanae]|nr:zinc ribbon domain-containing protein [Methanosphaera stadtmanae]